MTAEKTVSRSPGQRSDRKKCAPATALVTKAEHCTYHVSAVTDKQQKVGLNRPRQTVKPTLAEVREGKRRVSMIVRGGFEGVERTEMLQAET